MGLSEVRSVVSSVWRPLKNRENITKRVKYIQHNFISYVHMTIAKIPDRSNVKKDRFTLVHSLEDVVSYGRRVTVSGWG